jgi:Rieske Fe-S protein
VPRWKDDFPIGWVDDHFVTRREFAKSLAWVSCASFVATAALAARGTLRRAEGPWPPRKVADWDELPIGGSKLFDDPGLLGPCILVRLDSERHAAFSQKCTHLGCPVLYEARQRKLHCPCHEGYFSVEDGSVLAGPPPRPLPRLELERRGAELWAVGVRA